MHGHKHSDIMEAGAVLLLLLASLGFTATQDFYGDSVSFMPPQKNKDGTFKVRDFYIYHVLFQQKCKMNHDSGDGPD